MYMLLLTILWFRSF